MTLHEPPLCLGGQGRTDASVERDGWILLWLIAAAVGVAVWVVVTN